MTHKSVDIFFFVALGFLLWANGDCVPARDSTLKLVSVGC